VLGRGRLQGPSRGLDALIDFVGKRLLPQDRVAVLAWNRAIDFTTSHARVVRLLERVKDANNWIDTMLATRASGLAAVYGSRQIPADVQKQIDDVFRDDGGTPARQVSPGRVTGARRAEEDGRKATDGIVAGDIEKERVAREQEQAAYDRPGSVSTKTGSLTSTDGVLTTDLPFEEYVSTSVQTLHDLESLYAGINYLRLVEGEKHLVFVTEAGLFLPRLEDATGLATLANDARVAIDTIQTGGLGQSASTFLASGGAEAAFKQELAQNTHAYGTGPSASLGSAFAFRDLRTISELTGGQASIAEDAGKAVERIDAATRFDYLLGYAPSNPALDGRYRRIVVKVARPNVTVLFRHGYVGRDAVVPFDRRAFLTYSRIASAGGVLEEVHDIAVRATAAIGGSQAGRPAEARVSVTIDASRVSFTEADGHHLAFLNVAVFCGDARGNLVGELWQTIDLKLGDASFERFTREGIPYTGAVPLSGDARFVKVVIYDFAADLVGSVLVRLK